MNIQSLVSLLVAIGRSGLPELVISAFIFRFAHEQHSSGLAFLGAFLLWPGLVNLVGFFRRRRPPGR